MLTGAVADIQRSQTIGSGVLRGSGLFLCPQMMSPGRCALPPGTVACEVPSLTWARPGLSLPGAVSGPAPLP